MENRVGELSVTVIYKKGTKMVINFSIVTLLQNGYKRAQSIFWGTCDGHWYNQFYTS
jgi:hypothetical protein